MKINVTENNMLYIRAIRDGHHTVQEIIYRLGVTGTAAYGNMRNLKMRGVIGSRQDKKRRYYYLINDDCQYIPCISEAGKTLPLGHPDIKAKKGVRGRNDPPRETNPVVEAMIGLPATRTSKPHATPLWAMG